MGKQLTWKARAAVMGRTCRGARSSLQAISVQALGIKTRLAHTVLGMDDNPSRGALPLSSHGQAVGPRRILKEEYSSINLFLKVKQSVPVCGKVLF